MNRQSRCQSLQPVPPYRALEVRGLLLLLLMGALCWTLAGCAGLASSPATTSQEVPEVEVAYGIRVESLHLSAAGAMLDFRYRVLDPAKAAPLLNGRIQPYLFDEARSARLGVPDTPVLGRIRQTARNNKILENRTYFVMFANPGKAVRSGDQVTLLLGDLKITDLTVQ
jgi:hypothetical protein